MTKKDSLILLLLFIVTFIPRLYRLDNPVADWHSWRQADTAAVARNMYQEGINLFWPKAHNYLPMNGLPNPERYFLNEFPIYNSIIAIVYKFTGVNESYARLITVCFAGLGTIFLYLLVKGLINQKIALLTSLVYALLPFNVYYGRVIMPDQAYVSMSILSLYLIFLWTDKDKANYAIFAGITAALAMLMKPYAIVLALPAAYLLLKKYRFSLFKQKEFYLFLLISLLPLLLWRYHINQHPEGMFGSGWLINQGDIRFKGAFFRWLVFERMNRLILATGGFVLFFFGLVAKKINKEGWFFVTWLISLLIYISYFARGNVTHDYYQLPLVPVACVFIAKGIDYLLSSGKGYFGRIVNIVVALSLTLLMLAFGWYEVRGFFNINHYEIIRAGKAVDLLTEKDARVIAPYSKDPAFLYQTKRNGWTDIENQEQVENWIKDGADYIVAVNKDDKIQYWMEKCKIVQETNEYVIIDLRVCDSKDKEQDEYLIGL